MIIKYLFWKISLAIINLLQERGLIDGIGLQGHFLEQADISVVGINLETLAETGLPIYVSEFDVNFADDARHANRLKDLFTTFWSNPSVLGVTHWGHLEGDVWRTDSFLIREDGTTRPGMDWLICFYEGGDDCTVPEYIPAGWDGGEFGLTLEAELYDDGRGVAALGNVVAFTDDGDWINFQSVNFEETWDTFWVTYAKGNTEVGSISLHIDSLDNDPILVVPLEPTAGWGSSDTLELAIPPVSGQHDLFIRFNDVGGVANLDSIRIGTPAPAGEVGSNIVSNGGFEDGSTTGWFSWDGVVSTTNEFANTGEYSLQLSQRSGNGPAAYSLTSLVELGRTYSVSMAVSIAGVSEAPINITQKVECDGEANFSWLANSSVVVEGEWTILSGDLMVPDCNLSDLLIYAEGPDGGIDIFIDDVSAIPTP